VTTPDGAMLEPTAENGLKTRSMVRFDKVATIDKSIIAGRIGSASPEWLMEQSSRFFAVFGFGEAESGSRAGP
jgi:mRNA interferase MazF